MRPQNLPPHTYLTAYSFIVHPFMITGMFLGTFVIALPLTYTSLPVEYIFIGGFLPGMLLGTYGGAYIGVTLFVFLFYKKIKPEQLANLIKYELRRFPFLASLIFSTLLKLKQFSGFLSQK